MTKRVTIKDIARSLGLTSTTISMVIHNNKSIPEKTREKVLTAIREMNYYPNQMARSLVYGKTNTIAVIAPFYHPLFFQQLMRGIESRVRSTAYHINQYSTLNDPERTETIIREIVGGKLADGLIFFNLLPDIHLQAEITKNQIPVVTIEADLEEFHSVTCDNHRGAYLATEYLIKQGHRDIILMTGSMALINSVEVHRVTGYKEALTAGNISYNVHNVYELEHHEPQYGAECLRKILAQSGKPEAIFCAAGDSAALGIIHEAHKQGLRIPGDLSLIGYNDQDFAPYLIPSLTTVRLPGQEMGTKAVDIILNCLNEKNNQPLQKINFDPQLIIRDSV